MISFISCNQKKEVSLVQSIHKISINDSISINKFTFYEDVLLSDDNEYPRTIIFRANISKTKMSSQLHKIRQLINYNDSCIKNIENQYVNLNEFSSFYQASTSVKSLIDSLKIPKEGKFSFFSSLYNYNYGISLGCKKWNGKITLKYNNNEVFGILDLFGDEAPPAVP